MFNTFDVLQILQTMQSYNSIYDWIYEKENCILLCALSYVLELDFTTPTGPKVTPT